MPTIHNKRRKYQPERKAQQRRRKDERKEFDYTAPVWRKFRKAKLTENPLCRYCLEMEPPRYTAATVLDHITPIREGGAEWDSDNLQSLCATCHNKKSGREAHSHFNKK